MLPQPDLTGEPLKAQRLRMLEDIAGELTPELIFPTSFDLSMRIRACLREGAHSSERLVSLISLEPLLSAKLVQLANSDSFNPDGIEIRGIQAAVDRLGMETVRTTALTITMGQIQRAREMSGFDDIASSLWHHSRLSASAACIIAKEMSHISPQEAQFAGLIHDLGAFYMLYRAAQYSELRARPDTVKFLIMQWHESIGVSVLGALNLPESIIEAVRDHDVLRTTPVKPKNMRDIVYLANLVAGGAFEWKHQDIAQETIDRHAPAPAHLALQEAALAHASELISHLGLLAQPRDTDVIQTG